MEAERAVIFQRAGVGCKGGGQGSNQTDFISISNLETKFGTLI